LHAASSTRWPSDEYVRQNCNGKHEPPAIVRIGWKSRRLTFVLWEFVDPAYMSDFVVILLTIGIGFAAGYGVREYVSYRRRRERSGRRRRPNA